MLIVIEVTDSDLEWHDITEHVLYQDATFTSSTNGNPGTCSFRIKDPATGGVVTTRFPDIGARIRLTIDGDVEWRGFVTRRTYMYPFDVEDTTDPSSKTRFIQIEGGDLNLLLTRRYVFDQDHPIRYLPEYLDTPDTEVIADLWANYADISVPTPIDESEIDLVSGVQNVGTIGYGGNRFKLGSPGWSIAQTLGVLAQNLGAIFYIDSADLTFYWVDDETVAAPYALSDQPTGGKKGYRELSVLSKADEMSNDHTVRGAGAGSSAMVVKRLEDSASIDRHGRWQSAVLYNDMYKQATADLAATTWVEGSPQNKRGRNKPAEEVRCVIFERGFRAGMVVDFESVVHDWQDNVPIRECVITFPTTTDVRWELTLSHDIDPGIVIADYPGPPSRRHLPWGQDVLCARGQVTDTFTRTVTRAPMEADLYNLWDDWGEWRDIEEGPGETWAHGEMVLHEAPVDPYGRWRDIYSSDIVTDDPDSPGFGNSYPDTPPPGPLWIHHGVFEEREYNTTSNGGGWGTSDSGEAWEVYQVNAERPVSFAVFGGVGVYDVGPWTGSGSTTEAGMKVSLGSPSYPIELYFEGRFEDGRLPGTAVTTGEMIWTFGDGGGSSDSLRLIRQTDLNQGFYIDPAGSAALPELDTGLIDITEWFGVRVYITADTIYAKVWQLADEEPFGYQASSSRSGVVADSFMVRAISPSSDVLFYIDNLTLIGLTGGCTLQTAYPYVEGTLKASVDGSPVTVIETGSTTFEIPSYSSGVIQVTYLRADAYEGDDVAFDPPSGDAQTEDDGLGGNGEWRWPCTGRISQDYGCTSFGSSNGYAKGESCPSWAPNWHDGIDITNAYWTPLRAPTAATVTYVGWNLYDSNPAYIIVLDAGGGYEIGMAHLQPKQVVSEGQTVAKGQLIGYMGSTGNSTGPHVHLEARHNGVQFDPAIKMNGSP